MVYNASSACLERTPGGKWIKFVLQLRYRQLPFRLILLELRDLSSLFLALNNNDKLNFSLEKKESGLVLSKYNN